MVVDIVLQCVKECTEAMVGRINKDADILILRTWEYVGLHEKQIKTIKVVDGIKVVS